MFKLCYFVFIFNGVLIIICYVCDYLHDNFYSNQITEHLVFFLYTAYFLRNTNTNESSPQCVSECTLFIKLHCMHSNWLYSWLFQKLVCISNKTKRHVVLLYCLSNNKGSSVIALFWDKMYPNFLLCKT